MRKLEVRFRFGRTVWLLFAALTACAKSRAPLASEPSASQAIPEKTPPASSAPVPLEEGDQPSTATDTQPARASSLFVVQSNNAFATHLYLKVSSGRDNLFLSPASIYMALGMTYAGARGETAQAMETTLALGSSDGKIHAELAALRKGFVSTDSKGPELRIANRLWGERSSTIEPAFLTLTQASYGAGFGVLDFAKDPSSARTSVNRWVSDETKGKIVDLLPPNAVTPLTRLILTNAIYFKGTWQKRFDKNATRTEPFALESGQKAQVPMMHANLTAHYSETATAQALELPYEDAGSGRKFSMVVLLPKQATGLPALETDFTHRGHPGLVDGLKNPPTAVRVSLPRFKLTWEKTLNEPLKGMGMAVAFLEGRADFSGITRAEKLHIHWVQHKAFVEVNEEGTEAAAATAVVMNTKSLRPPPKEFRADRPFLFFISDVTTKTILFMGRITDPTKST